MAWCRLGGSDGLFAKVFPEADVQSEQIELWLGANNRPTAQVGLIKIWPLLLRIFLT